MDGRLFDVRTDSPESEPQIDFDLPLHDHETADRDDEPAGERERVEPVAAPRASRGAGLSVGMLVIGLLCGFGGGFLVGQRMMPPPAPRAVEVPRPAPAPAPPVVNLPPVEIREPEVQRPAERAGPPAPARRGAAARARRPPSGSLQLDSRPPAATVYVDDVRVGVTPVTMRNLSPGVHLVRMEMLGHRSWSTSVNVEAGAALRVGAALE